MRFRAIGTITFDPDETDGLRQLFGKGLEGARFLLFSLDCGRVDLPMSVTSATLDRYARLAQDAITGGRDKIGVQALRLQAIQRLMERHDASPSPK